MEEVMRAAGLRSRTFEQTDLVEVRHSGLNQGGHATPHLYRGLYSSAGGPNGLPPSLPRMVGGRGGGLPLKSSGTHSENQQDRPNLGLIRRTRPWAEGGGWLLTSQRRWEPEAPLLGRPVLLTFAAGKAVGRVG